MKNLLILLGMAITGSAVASEGIKALQVQQKTLDGTPLSCVVEYGNYSEDQDFTLLSTEHFQGMSYVEGSMVVSQEENQAYYLTSSTNRAELVVLNASTGESIKRNPIQGGILSAKLVPEKDLLVAVIKTRNHNPYGHNNDDISLAFFDLNTGLVESETSLKNLSLSIPKATFSGDVLVSQGNFSNAKMQVALSNLVYLAASEEIVFAATDVMGINRVYTYDMRKFQLVRSVATDEYIFGLKYNEDRNELLAMADRRGDGVRHVHLGVLDIKNGTFNSMHNLGAVSPNQDIQRGIIDVDPVNQLVYTYIPTVQDLYSFIRTCFYSDSVYSTNTDVAKTQTHTFFDIEKPSTRTSEPTLTLINAISVYPNPAVGTVHISRDKLVEINRMELFTISGQIVKDVVVNSDALDLEMNVSGLEPGVYMLRASTQTDAVVKRIVVQ